ncbi:hypothetical protein SAMN05421847_2165 [Halpernia humi]|uniref:Uncharacterized protein n=1 Tax=Halpernia humi TaxID=493375 RepID=A0A1H5ZR47_9FLAO|nr:hypothetical protein [Halpernia humi]SEG38968.1 hypothetical protein SAMN05421847_2165 [Halpernia humi]
MRKFIAKHQITGLKITFQFDLNEVLRIMEVDGDWTPEQVKKILAKVPTGTTEMLEAIKYQKKESAWIFSEISDISFAAFHKRYPRKVGLKEITEKAYNKLSEADKMEAILYIAELIKLKNDGTAFPYPATYLNKKYWK